MPIKTVALEFRIKINVLHTYITQINTILCGIDEKASQNYLRIFYKYKKVPPSLKAIAFR